MHPDIIKNRMAAFLTAAVLLFCSCISDYAAPRIVIDGNVGNLEWNEAEKAEVFRYGAQTNSLINYAFMKIAADRQNKAVYLAFQVQHKSSSPITPDNTNIGVRLFIKPGTTVTCTAAEDTFDRERYSLEKSIKFLNETDFTMEIKLGCLFGVPEIPLEGLQLIDGNGGFSSYVSMAALFPNMTSTEETTEPPATSTTKKESSSSKTTTKRGTGDKTGGKTQPSTSAKERATRPPRTGSATTTRRNQSSWGSKITQSFPEESGFSTVTSVNSNDPDDTESFDSAVNNYETTHDTGGGFQISGKQIAAIAAAAVLVACAALLVIRAGKKPSSDITPSIRESGESEEPTEFDSDF